MSSKGLSKRTAKGFEEILNAARAAGLTGSPSETGTPGHAALYYLALNDPIMSAAMQSARESLPGFLALTRHPGPTMERFAVKIALLGEGGPDAGVTKGNYSARAILKAALPRDRTAFKRRFGLESDF